MDNLKCNGNDKNISDCSAIFSTHNCRRSDNIWLQCQGKCSIVLFIKIINNHSITVILPFQTLFGRALIFLRKTHDNTSDLFATNIF